MTGCPSRAISPDTLPRHAPNSAMVVSMTPEPSRPKSPSTSPWRTSMSRWLTTSRPPESKTHRSRAANATPPGKILRAGRCRAHACADHLVDDSIARSLGGHEAAADAPVAHDDDAVRNLEYFGQPVRDENDGDATRAECAHPLEQPHRLALGQRGGGFVEDQKAGVLGEGADDQDKLLGRKVEVAEQAGRVDVDAEILQRGFGARAAAAAGRPGQTLTGSLLRKRPSATVRSGATFTSCARKATPAASASATEWQRSGAPLKSISPE